MMYILDLEFSWHEGKVYALEVESKEHLSILGVNWLTTACLWKGQYILGDGSTLL